MEFLRRLVVVVILVVGVEFGGGASIIYLHKGEYLLSAGCMFGAAIFGAILFFAERKYFNE